MMLEVLRKQLVDIEGLRCDLIKTIMGNAYYPYKLIDAAKAKLKMKAWKAGKMDIKTKDRPLSPVPGTSHSCRGPYETSDSSFRSNLQLIMKRESSPSLEEQEGSSSSSFLDQSPPKKKMFLDGASGTISSDKKLRSYKMENIVEGLKFIMKTNRERGSVVQGNHEAREAIDLMFAIATVFRLNALAEKPSPRERRNLLFLRKY
ncbi:uncharacterized protein LOC135203022 [Macrobrachium nipponense]|uniref:uncharacterized protein LOC135203022 n=1 Tax=Macrobrachium nipponense TaxID=159736 RepID=UPI0030C8A8B0